MITIPGVYNIPAVEYHTDPCPTASLSCSIAKVLLAHSPRHAWMAHPRLNPNFQCKEKEQWDIGTAAHAALLEGKDVCVPIDEFKDWRKDAAKALRDSIRAEGKTPLLRRDYDTVQAMVGAATLAIANCPDLSGVTLADGKPEQTLIWQDNEVWCRSRIDWISNERDIIIDYKTTAASASPASWGRTMAGMGGEIQPVFYSRGNAATGGPATAKFVFLVQETDPPHVCSFIGLSPEYMNFAGVKVDDAIRIWGNCLRSGKWPGYTNRIAWIEPTPWATAQHEELMTAMGERE